MLGRGIDQILEHPSNPQLHERYVKNAQGYVELAEALSGPIPRRVPASYVWGDALEELERASPAARIINLETTITVSEDWQAKGINYRMHPRNAGVLSAARIDACALANNHILDWGEAGLLETLEVLRARGIQGAGAGRDIREAQAPAVVPIPGGRVLLFSFGTESSGVPPEWTAANARAGVEFLESLSGETVERVRTQIAEVKRKGDLVIASIHWGDNWGYDIPLEQRRFARALIDLAGVDLIHGHSSHHAKGIEVFRDKLILYGCGDFVNDYEGIEGYEEYRGDLSLMYFPRLESGTGRLMSLRLVPMQMRGFRLRRASREDVEWLAQVLGRERSRVRIESDGSLVL
ncbi:MAG: CapA family protein [Bdellovibrionota bacterium]